MVTTDPIADMLTRIRNANTAKHNTVDIPASKMKLSIANILFKEGYIKSFEEIAGENQATIRVTLKYDEKGKYSSKEDLPKVLNGLGIAIVSTSKGIMTDKEARQNGLGGEVIAYVW